MATKKKKPAKRKVKGKAKRKAKASTEPTPEAIKAAEDELQMRAVIASYLFLPPTQVHTVLQAVDAEGGVIPNVASVTVSVNINTATMHVARRQEEERRRAGAVGR